MREFEIKLENVRMFAHHGVFEHERRDGNEFEVNVSLNYKVAEPNKLNEDELGNTVSYVDLWDVVKEEMVQPRKLLETVASSIVEKMKEKFPSASRIECKITKINPPIPSFTGTTSVSYRWVDSDPVF